MHWLVMEVPPEDTWSDIETQAKDLKIRLPKSCVREYFDACQVPDGDILRNGCQCNACGTPFYSNNSSTLKTHLENFHQDTIFKMVRGKNHFRYGDPIIGLI